MNRRFVVVVVSLVFATFVMAFAGSGVVVADSVTHIPLANASVFDRHGALAGFSDGRGRLPSLNYERYPVTVCYLGFKNRVVRESATDTIFLQELCSELPEVVVESRRDRVLYMLAYVREYSMLTTYTDTVFLFREKMVDYVLPCGRQTKLKGWSMPRVLSSKSYYRFTDASGLDSVSDAGRHHFSWTDWIGLPPAVAVPKTLADSNGEDTVCGRYGPVEMWRKEDGKIAVSVDVLADTMGRKWVPGLASFFGKNLDFEKLRFSSVYENADVDSVSPHDMISCSYEIESNGRGYDMFRFNHVGEPCFVSTVGEVYVMDREYITVREARKREQRKDDGEMVTICEPLDAPELSESIRALVGRVGSIDKEGVRLGFTPDRRMAGDRSVNRNFRIGRRALFLLRQLTGAARYRSQRNLNRQWGEFCRERHRASHGGVSDARDD